jgi:hypothetical protein
MRTPRKHSKNGINWVFLQQSLYSLAVDRTFYSPETGFVQRYDLIKNKNEKTRREGGFPKEMRSKTVIV